MAELGPRNKIVKCDKDNAFFDGAKLTKKVLAAGYL